MSHLWYHKRTKTSLTNQCFKNLFQVFKESIINKIKYISSQWNKNTILFKESI